MERDSTLTSLTRDLEAMFSTNLHLLPMMLANVLQAEGSAQTKINCSGDVYVFHVQT